MMALGTPADGGAVAQDGVEREHVMAAPDAATAREEVLAEVVAAPEEREALDSDSGRRLKQPESAQSQPPCSQSQPECSQPLQLPVSLKRDLSGSLTAWHRRRRAIASGRLDFSGSGSLRELSGELTSFSSLSPCPSPEENDGAAEASGFCMMSPLTCPSPAEFIREDLIKRNAREFHDEYDLGRCLGKGSFGQVHEATHKRTGARRAVKELEKSGTETADFEWELQALVALDHPHIVKVIEWFDDEDLYYIVMELCTGPDLSAYALDRMESECPDGTPERDVSIILRHCLKSVLCCHANGFVHRDLNAKNFMLTGSDRTVKLIDFGLATRFKGFVPRDRSVEIVGTSHYMAPEMMLEGEYSPAVDMWSLGVLLYVLLTGMMLLPKDDERKAVLLKRPGYIQKRLNSCKALQKRQVSEQVRDLLEKMLQRDPKNRITASAALSHPFILNHCHEHLGPPSCAFGTDFDDQLMEKLRLFGKAPRLKKVALLFMAHLADHERELLSARHTFRTIDRDGDGVVTLDELQEALAAHGIQEPADLDEVFAACNSDGSGKLSFVEFLACLFPESLVDERLCHEAFNLLDREDKGRLSAKDLEAVCPHYTLQRCEKLVSQADTTRKGHFDFDDFHRLLRGEDAVADEPPRLKVCRVPSYDYEVPPLSPEDSPSVYFDGEALSQ